MIISNEIHMAVGHTADGQSILLAVSDSKQELFGLACTAEVFLGDVVKFISVETLHGMTFAQELLKKEKAKAKDDADALLARCFKGGRDVEKLTVVQNYKRQLAGDKVLSPFIWKTNDGIELPPSEMKTSHLFHTVCMLWHHTMPEDAELYPHRKYIFDRRFTDAYTRLAIRVLLAELLTRNHDYWDTIDKMFSYLRKNQNVLAAGPLRLTN